MPTLDYSNPLFTFTSSNSSTGYTATQDCYVFGSVYAAQVGSHNYVYLNGNNIFNSACSNSDNGSANIVFFKISSGDRVSLETFSGSTKTILRVYKEK